MKFKKMLAALLCTATLLSTVPALPAVAAEVTSFPDITDPVVAEAAELLHQLGIINGYDDGCYHPNDPLTRAQFCRLAVDLRGEGDKAATYERYTYFTDVKGDHWARGYINYASQITVNDTERLVSGVGDGSFRPDRTINQAEAVTMCLRLLGYGLSDVGSSGLNWFDGYMSAARRLGLLKDITEDGTAELDRGTAAILFRNLLSAAPKTSGDTFFEALGGTVSQTLIYLGTDQSGQVRVRDEDNVFLYKSALVSAEEALIGTPVTLVLDKDKRVLQLRAAENVTVRTLTLAAHEVSYITTAQGERLSIDGGTPLYQGTEQTTYRKAYMELRAGSEVKLVYNQNGTLAYLYVEPVDAASLDVAVTRVTCIYEDASPSPKTPLTITALGGAKLTVLEQAAEALSTFTVGDRVTLLLTAEGKVAGVTKPDANAPSTLLGVVTATTEGGNGSAPTATVKPVAALKDADGNELSITGKVYSSNGLENRLALVSVSADGYLTLSSVGTNSVSDSLNVATRTLGNTRLSDSVALYERTLGSTPQPITWSQITVDTVPASKISYVGTDLSGSINLIVLSDVTGDGYTYGFLSSYSETTVEVGVGGLSDITYTFYYVSVENSAGKHALRTLYTENLSGAAGIAANSNGRLGDTVTLLSLSGVSRADFDMDALTVTVGGVTYPVSQTVECYNRLTGTWFGSGAEALNTARAYASTMTLYYDKAPAQGGKVRLAVVG